ncbi:MAG: hypothetical protein PWQ83_1113 [Thermosipho sp. (in: thermotogales)]|nr:hypothetical protein [Thermosipho sp. (in: thermotogales)]
MKKYNYQKGGQLNLGIGTSIFIQFDYIVEVKDIYFFFDDYILNLEWNSQQNVDFNKLLTKYNEFKKIIMEVEK